MDTSYMLQNAGKISKRAHAAKHKKDEKVRFVCC